MRIARLGEICQFQYGRSLPASNRVDGPIEVYGSNGVVGTHSFSITDGAAIVVGRKGSVGEVHYSKSSCWPIDTTYYIDSTSTSEDLRWLYYALKKLSLSGLNKATGIPGLNRNDAYDRQLFVPTLPEQRRLAVILDQVDALRGLRRRSLSRLSDLGQAIFHEMFGDPKIGMKGCDALPFDRACSDATSRFDKIQRGDYLNEGHVAIVDQGKSSVAGWANDVTNICQSDRPVVVFGDHTRTVKFIDFPFVVGADGAKVLVPSESFEPIFFAELLKQMPLPDLGYSRHMRELKKMTFPCPDLDSQRQFSARMAALRSNVNEMKKAEQTLDALFASLQHRAFRGEL